MFLYKKDKKGHLKQVKQVPFKLEKNVQQIFEDNLDEIMGLQFIDTEYVVKDKRFDTVAFDEQNKSFVIIEYKRDKSTSVVDQGMTYLYLMLQNKSQFVLDYNNKFGKQLTVNNVDWTQSRIVFVASSFNDFQQTSSLFDNLAIELWEAKQFEDGHLLIGPLPKKDTISMPIPKTPNTKSASVIAAVSSVVKPITEETLLQAANDSIKELYANYRRSILALDDSLEIKPNKLYVVFKQQGKNKVDIEIHKNYLLLYVNAKYGQLDDSKSLFENCSNIGHWGNGDYRIKLTDDKYLQYVLSVIKQVLK